MAGDELPVIGGGTGKDSCMDQDRQTQAHKKLSHSIEEILSRPACVRREAIVHRDWPVLKETTTSHQHMSAGMFVVLSSFNYFISNSSSSSNRRSSILLRNTIR